MCGSWAQAEPIPAAGVSVAPARNPVRGLQLIPSMSDLARLTRSDPVVSVQVDSLVRRRHTAAAILFVTLPVALAGAVWGAVGSSHQKCDPQGECLSDREPSTPLLIGSAIIGIGGVLAALIVNASRDEEIDTVNQWNSRHPDEPLTLVGPGLH